MNELEFDLTQALPWFPHQQDAPYTLVQVSEEHAAAWAEALGVAVRRCYISDAVLKDRAQTLGLQKSQILAAKLPDPGSTMAGDFGEILVYFYQAVKENSPHLLGAKKWRFKHDRTKPASHSDVVQFVLPSWPASSENDVLLCAEVKTKATSGVSTPIASAIEDCEKDRTSRLARTLVWLRERAMTEGLGQVTLAHLNRFINAVDHPPYSKRFRAVAVICARLVANELRDAPTSVSPEYEVVVISVPELRETYSRVFAATHNSVLAPPNEIPEETA